ncbi:MAG TPA: SBBP repeat-containing protein [Polyangium sp.]|nr:SBBP repeat-containing protein [Polyangium sp.]
MTKVAAAYGDTAVQTGSAIAVDKSGNVFMAGAFGGKMNLGGATLTSAGGDDAYLAKFAAGGQLMWAKSFGDSEGQGISGVSVDSSGNVYVTGTFYGSVNFGGGALNASGALYSDVFLAKLGPDGSHLWSKRFGDDNAQSALALAADANGNIIVTGYFQNIINFGGGDLNSAGNFDIFMAKFNSSGAHQWSRRFGDAARSQYGRSVAIDGMGNVYLAGDIAGSIDFGGGAMPVTTVRSSLIAKFDSFGNANWAKVNTGDANSDSIAYSVAVGPNGEVAAGGYFKNKFDLDGMSTTSTGVDDAFITLFSATGTLMMTKTFGDMEQQRVASLGFAPNGDIFATGDFSGAIDFETGMATMSTGLSDGYVVRLTPNGCPSWLRTFTGPMAQLPQALAVDPTTGGVAVTGQFIGSTDFGTGVLPSAGVDAFLALLNP